MIIKSGVSGGQLEITDAPQITFSGKWLPWHIEFYGDTPYWEAWFFSSGTLTAKKDYTVDVWGIGGGSSGPRSALGNSAGGRVGQSLGVSVAQGTVSVTIGAGGDINADYSADRKGRATKFAGTTIAEGAQATDTPSSADKRYRFGHSSKSDEAGTAASSKYGTDTTYTHGAGWLPFSLPEAAVVDAENSFPGLKASQGFGAAGTLNSSGMSGALVIRIPA